MMSTPASAAHTRMSTHRVSTQEQSTSAGTYLSLAMLAFALLGLELVLLLLEPYLPFGSESLGAAVVHWALTSLVWVTGSACLVVWAYRRTDFSRRSRPSTRVSGLCWFVIALLVLMTWAGQWALRGGVLPPIAEHAALVERFGEAGLTAWLVQLVYYGAELSVMILILGFGQRAGDQWQRRRWIPWGGVALSVTWGLVHFLTQDPATGLYGMALSLIMGTIFLLTGRNHLVTYLLLLALFII